MDEKTTVRLFNCLEGVLNILADVQPFYRAYIAQKRNVLYGSFIWRTLMRLMRIIHQDESKINLDQILKDVISDIIKDGGDLDIFLAPESQILHFVYSEDEDRDGVGRYLKHRGRFHGRGGHELQEGEIKLYDTSSFRYEWLAYRHEQSLLASCKNEMMKLSGDVHNVQQLLDATSQLQKRINRLKATSIPKMMATRMKIRDHSVLVQMHHHCDNDAEQQLNDAFAPFFTVEALMWVYGKGLVSRFGVPVNTVLEHLRKRELHIVNCAEIEKFFHGANRPILKRKLIDRLIKYKKYGFTLHLDKEDVEYTFIPKLINKAMLRIISLYRVDKRAISRGQRSEAYPDPDRKSEVEDAFAIQAIHQDYLTSMIGHSTGMDADVASIVAGYAARANEEVYHEDKTWQNVLQEAREALEKLLKKDPYLWE